MTDTNALAPTDQSRAKFDLWYADHIGDENKPVREAAWETWQHLYEQAAPAQAEAPAHAARAAQAEPEDLSVAYFMGLHAAKRAPQPAAQAQEGESGWLRSEALLYRLTDDRRQENFDEIQVTMANGSRDIHQRSAQAERLQVMLTAPQPAAHVQEEAVAQAVAAEREACAQLAAQTVCDLHIPTGVKIYGSKAARAIRARGTDAARAVYSRSMDLVRVFWQQHTQADALSMTMAELHADAERAIRAAIAAPAQAEAPAGVEAVGEMRASELLGVAPYADIWGWLQPGTKLYSATQVQAMLAAAPQPPAQAGWCDGCSPDNCGGCATSAAPVPAVQQDAERYRWLREYAIGAYITAQGKGSTAIYLLTKVPALDGIGEETDAAIDAARAAQEKP